MPGLKTPDLAVLRTSCVIDVIVELAEKIRGRFFMKNFVK